MVRTSDCRSEYASSILAKGGGLQCAVIGSLTIRAALVDIVAGTQIKDGLKGTGAN